MKIFNWVHRRFHHNNTLKDGFASNMKKTESTINNNIDSQALLKQVALTDMLGDWKDGILTIGTLGYDDSLKSINHHKDYFALEAEKQHDLVDDDDDVENFYNVEQEELNPLINSTLENNFEDVVCENHDDFYHEDVNARKEEEMMIRNFKEIVEVPLPPMICHEIIEANDVEGDQKKRITLADLFLADSDVKMKLDYSAAKVLVESSEKPNLKAKNGLSFAKKIIPLVKENSHPMKDIKKLMKKMLKRKIHPADLDVKNHKAEGNIIGNHMNEGNGSSYFIPV